MGGDEVQDPSNQRENLMDLRLNTAKRYLREHGISQPRVQIGALYVPPATWQQPITKEMSIIQEVLLNGNGQRASRS
jgi:hypothetical protein